MPWIGRLLMILGVSAGCYGAMTAYHVPIDAPDAEIRGLTLNDSAGARLDARGVLAPIAKSGEKLDGPTLTQLRANTDGIAGRAPAWRMVRVKEFSWQRWPGKWLFVGSSLALLVGAVLARGAREFVAPSEDGSVLPFDRATLAQLVASIETLIADTQETRPGITKTICDRVDEMQRRWITPLVRGQSSFIAKYGVGRAAETLSALAAVERYLNRAWSAAADDYYDEAVAALQIAERNGHAAREQLAQLQANDPK